MAHSQQVSSILIELEAVLREEHDALRKLDRDRISRAAEEKLALDARFRTELTAATALPGDPEALRRIRRSALENQLLIVHARATVQGVLSMVAGEPVATYPGATPSRAAPSPLRLSVRG